ncbi:MAG: heavy metal translocating P-type ATPase [Caldimicrobium sp.]
MEKVTLKVEGMTCVNCAKAIELSLNKLKGVRKVEVSFELGRVLVEFEEEFLSVEEIKMVIESFGYKVASHKKKKDYQIEILIFSFLSSLLIMGLMFYHHPYSLWLQALLSISVQIIGGLKFYKGALSALKARIGNMDLLVSLGTTAALIYSLLSALKILPGEPFFETNAFLISFVLLGKFIEEKIKNRALNLLKELFALQTATITLLTPEGEKEVSIKDVLPGDVIVLKTGDLVPLDGEIIEGTIEVDESLVTGESLPVLKKPSDSLISGSVVVNGYCKAKIKALFEKSYVSLLIELAEEALKQKPKIQRIADLVSHYFVQIIVLLSIGVFFFWMYKSGDLALSFNFSLAVLVISCPCAFGLAVPLAISVGLVRAYKSGLLVKDPTSFEKASLIKALILDKTGTLTVGKPKVIDYKEYEEGALSIAYGLAKSSKHPYSQAIVNFAKSLQVEPFNFQDCKEEPGKGVFCGEYFLGRTEEREAIVLKKGDKILAEFLAEDEIRPESKEIIQYLKSLGLKIILATGDTYQRAKKIADILEIAQIYAEVKSKNKLKIVEDLQKKGLRVAMVGDGINDAPALAKADLSFVLAVGVDLSKRVGEVVLLSGLNGLKAFFEIAKFLKRRIWQNLFWAFVYNLLGIPIAGGLLYSQGIILKPQMAGLMMAFSSVSVVLNSIRK